MTHQMWLTGVGIVLASVSTPQPDRGTPAQAEALLAKAVAHYETAGRTQALADFTARKAPFADRDLYVFCIAADRRVIAHGGDATQVGVVFDTLKDVDGKAFGTALWDAGIKAGGGSVEYKWQNPVSKRVEQKISFVRPAGKDVCGVGAYRAAK